MAWRRSLQSILENIFLALKHHFIEKNVFDDTWVIFLRCFEWKYCAVSENVFSMSVIYLHFSYCKFSLFLWIYWIRFKTWLAKGPVLELAAWIAKSTKSKSLIYWAIRENIAQLPDQHGESTLPILPLIIPGRTILEVYLQKIENVCIMTQVGI